MVTGENKWDIKLLHDVFENRDLELIKRIPLPLIDKVDSWFWVLDEKREFTVRSCYRWLQGECQSEYKMFWKRLWTLKLPCKVTNFLLHVCKGCLPTSQALVVKHVNIDAQCPWCHREIENDVHMMFSCDFSKTMWMNAGLVQFIQILPHDTTFLVILEAFEICTREQSVQIDMLCWSIWNRRNKWVWGKANGSVFGVRVATTNLLKDLKEAQMKAEDRRTRGEIGAHSWTKPAYGWVKININAAVFQDGSIGVGGGVRDSQGRFIGVGCRKVEGVWHPRDAEAIGLKEALSWVIDQGYNHFIFETDSKSLVVPCKGNLGKAFFGTIVVDCIHLSKHINLVLVDFVYRSANSVAHVLAQAAYSMSNLGECYTTSPTFLTHILDLDMF